jgi:serine/threonine protein kinase
VAAILKVGPQLRNLLGFDIVVFKDCAEFCMEQCRPIYEFSAAMMRALKLKLRSLHCLNIVHLDIKPDNISFSPSLNEPILLDFGFSDVVEDSVGKRTKTAFAGTLGFSSPEMVECYNNRCPSYVDVYYNDVFALSNTINHFR